MPEQVIPLNQNSPEPNEGKEEGMDKKEVLVENDSLAENEKDKPSRPSLTIETEGGDGGNGGGGKVIAESAPPGGDVTPNRRASLLKQKSSFLSPTGQHIDKPRQGRRLSFSDESGENLVHTNFSDSLHYSNKQAMMFNNGGADMSGGGSKGCCVIS